VGPARLICCFTTFWAYTTTVTEPFLLHAQVFMVAHDAVLDKPLLRKIIASGHSRIPVHRPGKPCAPGWTARPSTL
jgi:hypothetical protein